MCLHQNMKMVVCIFYTFCYVQCLFSHYHTILKKGLSCGLILKGVYYWREFFVSEWAGIDNKNSWNCIIKYKDNLLKQLTLRAHGPIYSGGIMIGTIVGLKYLTGLVFSRWEAYIQNCMVHHYKTHLTCTTLRRIQSIKDKLGKQNRNNRIKAQASMSYVKIQHTSFYI